MSENAITVNVDEYLAVNKYEVDEGNPPHHPSRRS